MPMWLLWAMIIVLGVIPIVFWAIYALLKVLVFVGSAAEAVLDWCEQRF
jgi:hypothetical protein